jgi:phage minor structural protein
MIITNLTGQTELLTDYKITARKRRVNGDRSLSFYVISTDRNAHSFPLITEECFVEYDGEHYRIKQIRARTVSGTQVKDVDASHILFDMVDDFQYATLSGTLNFVQACDHLFAPTDWTYVNQGAFASVDFDDFGNANCLALFQTVLDRYGAEYTINSATKTVTFKNKIGAETDAQFRYNHNVKTLQKDVNTNDLSTYIKGFGQTTKDTDGNIVSQVTAEYTSPNASLFGIKHAPPVKDESFTSSSSLLSHLTKVLKDEPEITLEMEHVELVNNGLNLHNYDLGDYVYVIYEPLGLDVKIRVLEITDYPESYKSAKVVLSNVPYAKGRLGLSEVIPQFDRTSKSLKTLTDKDGNLSLSLKRLYRNSNHYSDNTGDWYISEDDPNAYVHIGAGGLDVHKGLVRVEREDGYAVIVGGTIQNGFNMQGAYPPFRTAGVSEIGPWVRAASTSRFENIQSFTFKHDSRYLVAKIGLYTDGGITGYMAFDLDTSDGDGTSTTTLATVTRASSDQGWTTYVTMDLGVPTGARKTLYVRMYGSDAVSYVYGRILYISQEG